MKSTLHGTAVSFGCTPSATTVCVVAHSPQYQRVRQRIFPTSAGSTLKTQKKPSSSQGGKRQRGSMSSADVQRSVRDTIPKTEFLGVREALREKYCLCAPHLLRLLCPEACSAPAAEEGLTFANLGSCPWGSCIRRCDCVTREVSLAPTRPNRAPIEVLARKCLVACVCAWSPSYL